MLRSGNMVTSPQYCQTGWQQLMQIIILLFVQENWVASTEGLNWTRSVCKLWTDYLVNNFMPAFLFSSKIGLTGLRFVDMLSDHLFMYFKLSDFFLLYVSRWKVIIIDRNLCKNFKNKTTLGHTAFCAPHPTGLKWTWLKLEKGAAQISEHQSEFRIKMQRQFLFSAQLPLNPT